MSDQNSNEFEYIRPYTDAEVEEAMHRLRLSPKLPVISMYLFPDKGPFYLGRLMKDVHTVDDFQVFVMAKMVSTVISRTTTGFEYSGLYNVKRDKKYLAVSNHRDIVLDPALVQLMLYTNDLPLTEICVGSNLVDGDPVVADMLRSNRMIKVIRGISARELYLSSQLLSRYIRESVASGRSSVWIAQREGRTKNGQDETEQGILKMFDMSGGKDFIRNFSELNITPFSISYEYEPCDMRKAREVLIRSYGKGYTKKRNEDRNSIVTGIRQWKGGVHLHVGRPLSDEEIALASACDKNDRYQYIRRTLDNRILRGYKLWKTNYMGYDLLNGGSKYAGLYGQDELEEFRAYTEKKLNRVERSLDRDELRKIFWKIYANPVAMKEKDLGEDSA